MSESHTVYIIGWRERGPTKIGIAKDPAARLVGLQGGCPYRLRLYRAFVLPGEDEARQVEDAALEALLRYAMQGEWVRSDAKSCTSTVIRVIERANLPVTVWRPTPIQLERRQAVLARDKAKSVAESVEEYRYLISH